MLFIASLSTILLNTFFSNEITALFIAIEVILLQFKARASSMLAENVTAVVNIRIEALC